jgi:hypothetical protein
MGASTSEEEAHEGILEQQDNQGVTCNLRTRGIYVETSMLFQACTVIGAFRLQNRDVIMHQDRIKKSKRQYIICSCTSILQLTERSEAKGDEGKRPQVVTLVVHSRITYSVR